MAKLLAIDVNFKKRIGILSDNTSLANETGYTIANINGVATYIPEIGTALDISFSTAQPIFGIMHAHTNIGSSMFSPDDLLAMYEIYSNDKMIDVKSFVNTVVTPHGTSYTAHINDEVKFKNLDLTNNSVFHDFSTDYNGFYHIQLILGKDPITAGEIAMLELLKNSGITLTKGNSDFSNWQKIEEKDNKVIEVNCN